MALAVLAVLAVGFASSVALSLHQANNYQRSLDARLAAESGLSHMLYCLEGIRLPSDTTAATMMQRLKPELADALPGGTTVELSEDGTVLSISSVSMPSGSFTASLGVWSDSTGAGIRLLVTGNNRNLTRRIQMDMDLETKRSGLFDYGIASRGKISIDGSALVAGMSDPNAAKVLSLRNGPPALEVSGSADVSGHLSVVGDSADYITIGPACTVGGSGDEAVIRRDHVSLGVEAPPFPEIDTTPFKAMAVNTYTEDDDDSASLSNIRIPAGSNPTFSSDIELNGVIYIESANEVRFSGGATINGLIVCDPNGAGDLADCNLTFRGTVSAPGVGALPEDDPQYTEVRKHVGTVILAPGYALDFSGNVSKANGVIAADDIDFGGNSGVSGELSGCILGLKDNEMTIQGSNEILLNRMPDDVDPAGFKHKMGFTANPSTYVEPTLTMATQ